MRPPGSPLELNLYVRFVGADEMIGGENTMPIIAPYKGDDGAERRACEREALTSGTKESP